MHPMSSMSIFVGRFHAQKRTPQVALSVLVSLLLHGLLLLYFGQHIFTTDISAYSEPPAVISLILHPPLATEISSTSEPSALAPSPSLSHGIGERTHLESSSSDSVQAVEESRSQSIDIEDAYGIARQTAKSRRGLVESQLASPAPPALEQETPLSRSISKSARKDCRTAHAGLGLLALPFLIADTITDRGCKW